MNYSGGILYYTVCGDLLKKLFVYINYVRSNFNFV